MTATPTRRRRPATAPRSSLVFSPADGARLLGRPLVTLKDAHHAACLWAQRERQRDPSRPGSALMEDTGRAFLALTGLTHRQWATLRARGSGGPLTLPR